MSALCQDIRRYFAEPATLAVFLNARLAEIKEAVGSRDCGLALGFVSRVLRYPINLPTADEQAEIVRRVESLFALADQLEARYTSARAQIDRLTPSLLAKAFRGELVPQDPNDEPAAALLARIHAQTAKEKAADKPKRGAARAKSSASP